MSCARSGLPSVLIVNDETAFRDVLAHVLRDQGYRVSVASTGREAVEAMSRERPGLVVLDHMMPEMTGDDLLDVMARHRTLASVPVILLSATREDAHRPLANVVAALRKPIKLDAFVEKVGTILRSRAG